MLLGCSIMAMHLAVNQATAGSNPAGPAKNLEIKTVAVAPVTENIEPLNGGASREEQGGQK